MDKEAQVSRQRNDFVVGERNKWNRSVDGFDSGTPWRVDRDQFYDFTHYHTDAISFDEDPNRVYSGEALWRMYVMDKFYREHKTADGKWVGGYINDRFHVFPDAGTPANPDVPRDGGNPMGLGINERTRKPRPHQYSTERRLEEARGETTEDIVFSTPVASTFDKVMKTASTLPLERESDPVYGIFQDCIDMKEAGIDYSEIIDRVSTHYGASITGVAQIAQFADKMVEKHDKIAYEFGKTANIRLDQQTQARLGDQSIINLAPNTELARTPSGNYQIVSGKGVGTEVMIDPSIMQGFNDDDINEAADEIGLNDDGSAVDTGDLVDMGMGEDFPIQEI